MRKDDLFGDGVPIGFGMALAQNSAALEKYSAMTAEQRNSVLARAGSIRSKAEMQAYVDSFVGWTEGHPPYQL